MSAFFPSHSLQGSFCKLQLLRMGSQLEQHHSGDIVEQGCCNRNLQEEDKHTRLPKHRVLMDLLFHLRDNRLRSQWHCCCMDLVTMVCLLPASPGTSVPMSSWCRRWLSPCGSLAVSIPCLAQDQVSSQWPWSSDLHTHPLLPHPTTATSFVVWPFRNLNGTHNI